MMVFPENVWCCGVYRMREQDAGETESKEKKARQTPRCVSVVVLRSGNMCPGEEVGGRGRVSRGERSVVCVVRRLCVCVLLCCCREMGAMRKLVNCCLGEGGEVTRAAGEGFYL